jgi:hypothetical protein
MSVPVKTVNKFSCVCSAHSEGQGEAPKCWSCGKQMRAWGTREVTTFSTVLHGESADKRNWNGGYS